MIMGKRYQRGRSGGKGGYRVFQFFSLTQPRDCVFLAERRTIHRSAKETTPLPPLHALERISPSVSFHAATIRRNDVARALTIPPRNTFFLHLFLALSFLPALLPLSRCSQNPLRGELILSLSFFRVKKYEIEIIKILVYILFASTEIRRKGDRSIERFSSWTVKSKKVSRWMVTTMEGERRNAREKHFGCKLGSSTYFCITRSDSRSVIESLSRPCIKRYIYIRI